MTYVYLYPTHAEAKYSLEKKIQELESLHATIDVVNFTRMEIKTRTTIFRFIVVPISIGIENIMGLECVCDPSRVIEVLQQTIKQIQAETQFMYIRARHIKELQEEK